MEGQMDVQAGTQRKHREQARGGRARSELPHPHCVNSEDKKVFSIHESVQQDSSSMNLVVLGFLSFVF